MASSAENALEPTFWDQTGDPKTDQQAKEPGQTVACPEAPTRAIVDGHGGTSSPYPLGPRTVPSTEAEDTLGSSVFIQRNAVRPNLRHFFSCQHFCCNRPYFLIAAYVMRVENIPNRHSNQHENDETDYEGGKGIESPVSMSVHDCIHSFLEVLGYFTRMYLYININFL